MKPTTDKLANKCKCGHEKNRHTLLDVDIGCGAEDNYCPCQKFTPKSQDKKGDDD